VSAINRSLRGIAPEFIASLPLAGMDGTLRSRMKSAPAGSVRLKTGHLDGVSGVAGYVTRGAVFCIVGAFLIDAAVSFDPQKAQGLDGSLRKTAATPLGPWLLLAVALGLVIFGLYSWCEARWRMVEPG